MGVKVCLFGVLFVKILLGCTANEPISEFREDLREQFFRLEVLDLCAEVQVLVTSNSKLYNITENGLGKSQEAAGKSNMGTSSVTRFLIPCLLTRPENTFRSGSVFVTLRT